MMSAESLILGWYTVLYDIKDAIATLSDPKLKNLHDKIRRNLTDQNKNWDSPSYPRYQGYDKIKWSGLRNTKNRVKQYGLTNYLKKDWRLLDIGCNTGFVSLEIANLVSKVDALDINPYLVKIAQDTSKFLGITNTHFITCGFEDFQPKEKYDAIFSFANHNTLDGLTTFSISNYFNKVCECLRPNGLLFFESHESDNEKWDEVNNIQNKKFINILEVHIPKENALMGERVFRILKKKG